jgi:hypothetical protein
MWFKWWPSWRLMTLPLLGITGVRQFRRMEKRFEDVI